MYKILFLLLILPAKLFAQQTLQGKVIKIVDGDTFDLLTETNTVYRIRLLDIDCPERGQDYYQVCKQALSDYIFGQKVNVFYQKKDRNGRILGTVKNGSVNVNRVMVQEGYAWHFKKYSTDQQFADAEIAARKSKRGLWASPKPIAPWDFRRMRHEKRASSFVH